MFSALPHSAYRAFFLFFFDATPPPEIYPLSLHDALPILSAAAGAGRGGPDLLRQRRQRKSHRAGVPARDRKSTRLNSSHVSISYAVFCLKKKNKPTPAHIPRRRCSSRRYRSSTDTFVELI